MSARPTHSVFAYDWQPYVNGGSWCWTCLKSGDEMGCQRFAARLRKERPDRRIEVREVKP